MDNNILSEYQKWKKQGDALRTQARQAMETRFRELLAEAVQISQEYQADFGAPLKPPAPVTAFRFKAGAKAAAKKKTPAAPKAAPAPPAPKDPKVTALEKRLAGAKKKLDAAKATGTSTKNLEDKVYELEDDLRLATQGA